MALLELEAPSTESLQSHAAHAASGLRLTNPEAEMAVDLLDADATGDEQWEGAKTITVRLVKDVSDDMAGFEGNTGDTFDAYIDADGNTWIPLATEDIFLEAEEFEVVEPLSSQEETAPVAAETIPPVAETIPPAVETPTPQVQPQLPPIAIHWDAHTRRRADYLREKDVLQEQISALMIEQAKLKEQAKRCKKEAEVYIEQLNELIENWENPAPSADTSPVPTGTAGGCVPTGHDQAATDITQSEPASSPDSPALEMAQKPRTEAQTQAAYRRTLESSPISQLGISEALQEKLTEAGAENLWTLEQLRSEVSLGKAKWPKGIGVAKVTAIEDAIMGWMSRNSASWDPVQGGNDAAEQQQDAELAADVAESQPPMPEAAAAKPEVSTDTDDL